MLPTYASIMSERIAALAESWRDGTVIDVPMEFQKLTSTILIATLYPDATFDPAAQQTLNDIRTVFDGVLRRSFTPPPFDRLPTPRNRAFEGAISRLRATLASLIADRRADEVNPGDMLSALLGAGGVDYPRFTDDEVTDQILTFFLGGTESTATTLTWALYLLDHHPQIASRLHAEVDEILAGRPAQFQDIPQLEFTGRIINETLRYRTPFWLLTRIVTEDTELGGYHLPARTTVFYSPHMLHHRPDVFVDPERFDPDRWESTAATVSPRQGFTPFGTGARKCIGDEFAVTQATLALATITAQWRFRTLADADTRLAPSVVQRPRRLHMRLTSRSTAHHAHALETA
jgi:pentalenene oxygenase